MHSQQVFDLFTVAENHSIVTAKADGAGHVRVATNGLLYESDFMSIFPSRSQSESLRFLIPGIIGQIQIGFGRIRHRAGNVFGLKSGDASYGFSRVVLALLVASLFNSTTALADDTDASARKTIVCSTTQVADFARQIVGDHMAVKCVMAPGQDPHTFEITPDAQKMVRTADLCLDNGMYLEGRDWMRTLAKQDSKPITSCTDGIKPLVLEEDGKPTKDPHAWFSPMNAAIYVNNVEKAVCEIDPERSSTYKARADLYRNQLRTLHLWIQRQFSRIPANQRVLVTSHDAFNYFCTAYGFTNQAPVGWSTQEIGAEVTPESRRLVIESIRKTGVPAIFVETSANPKAIQDIAKEAGVKIGGTLYSDSMGTAGSAGETYVGMMVENVLSIVEALAPKAEPASN